MRGYSTRDVAELLAISPAQVRRFARQGFLEAKRGQGGRYLFSFRDVAIIRTFLELSAADVPAARLRSALKALRRQLPRGQPLTAVRIGAEGGSVIARDEWTAWDPESGQVCLELPPAPPPDHQVPFSFAADGAPPQPAPVSALRLATGETGEHTAEEPAAGEWTGAHAEERTADEWFDLGCDLQESRPEDAVAAFRNALDLEPAHIEARVNLGYLLHQAGRIDEAISHYETARRGARADSTAAFNLGVALEDVGRCSEAIEAYRQAVTIDPELADAHYNLARLCEQAGDRAGAFEHLRRYRALKNA